MRIIDKHVCYFTSSPSPNNANGLWETERQSERERERDRVRERGKETDRQTETDKITLDYWQTSEMTSHSTYNLGDNDKWIYDLFNDITHRPPAQRNVSNEEDLTTQWTQLLFPWKSTSTLPKPTPDQATNKNLHMLRFKTSADLPWPVGKCSRDYFHTITDILTSWGNYTHTHTHMHVCMYATTRACMQTHTHTHTQTHMYIWTSSSIVHQTSFLSIYPQNNIFSPFHVIYIYTSTYLI